jgi:putative peptidoglycan lipid II flippase
LKTHEQLRRTGRSLLTVNGLILAALGIGFLNNVVAAAIFGLTRRVDAFFAAAMLPSLFMALCVDYLGKNFLPVLALAKTESDECASTMTSSVVTIVTLLAIGMTGVLLLLSRPLFDLLLPGFDADDLVIVTHYFWIMSPAIVFMAINTFHEYVCQYDNQFVFVSASRVALPAANLVGMVALAPFVHEYCLPLGFLIGHVTVFFMLARRAPYRYRPRITIRPHLERRVFTNSAVVMSTGVIARTKSIIMNYLGSTLGGGAITALAMATKLTEPLERSAFAGARMVMFSHTARLFVERNDQELGRLYSMGLRVAFMLLTPLLWWVGLNSHAIVKAFFERGQFTPEMAALVAVTLTALIPSVLFLGVNQLLSNAFYAMNRVKVPASVMPFGTLIYVAVAVPLSAILSTQGIALATTATSVIIFGALLVCLARIVPAIRPARTAGQLLGYGVLSGGALLTTNTLVATLDLPPAAVALLSLPLGVSLYVLALALFRDETYVRCRDLALSFLLGPRPRPVEAAPPR